ncbi:hypothetical protein [Pseudomonas oryzihabitans]|uniref:hypothetical protein n=1 Tax=Pseudomonas oryzihabitans TaxID=47885 RepID=UPI0011A20AE8|nr:hypothetical protein [Pseudomonas oryzihabitans]
MTASDWIALGSAAFSAASFGWSIFSYGSAKASAAAAKEANRLTLHGYHRALFCAFQDLRTYIKTTELVDEVGIRSRFSEAQFTAGLYVNKSLEEELRRVYALSLAIVPVAQRASMALEDMVFWVEKDKEKEEKAQEKYAQEEARRLTAVYEAERAFDRVANKLIAALALSQPEK